MKKLLAIVLATIMVATLSVSVFAASDTSETQNVVVKLSDTEATAYDVIIAWGDFEFEYNVTTTWNTENKAYTRVGAFDSTSSDLTITNNSNVKVAATIEIQEDDSDILGIALEDEGQKTFTMEKATEGAPVTVTVNFELTGALAFDAAVEADDLTEEAYAELKEEYKNFTVGTIELSLVAKNVGE